MKGRSQWPIFILRSYWLIIPNNNVRTSNSLQDIKQNHWTMEYRSQWPTLILRSNVGSYWLTIPNNNVHTSNSLQDIRQNHWTMEYRSQWPTLILRSNIGSYWFILPKYDVHTSNSLQDIRQNQWTVKYRSCWPSLHDPQIHVTRFSHVRPTICISCCHKRKSRKTLFVCLCWGLTSQSTIFQSCQDGANASWVINQYFQGVKCLAQGHNMVAVGFEPPTSRSGVRHSTTEPPRSPKKTPKKHFLKES